MHPPAAKDENSHGGVHLRDTPQIREDSTLHHWDLPHPRQEHWGQQEEGQKRTPPRPAQTGAVEGGATRREGRERVRPVGLDDRSSGRHAGDPACRADGSAAYASIVSTAYCPARRPPQ